MNTSQIFHAKGKLLLSGEYFVLDGALSLAIPTSKGQKMRIDTGEPGILKWKSYLLNDEKVWFEAKFDLHKLSCKASTDIKVAGRLEELFQSVRSQNEEFWPTYLPTGLNISTHLEFPRKWGLGTSSTLISLLAQWSNTNPYTLLGDSFGGSGYDLACATAIGPIFYQRRNGKPIIEKAPFKPPFSDHIYFVYLGKKQNSREGIERYRLKVGEEKIQLIRKISALTKQMVSSKTLEAWNACIEEHEEIISKALDLPKVKSLYFEDFLGTVKSLGAWGGDFVMVSSEKGEEEVRNYFLKKGFKIVLRFNDLLIV